jgi:hypothetical protein
MPPHKRPVGQAINNGEPFEVVLFCFIKYIPVTCETGNWCTFHNYNIISLTSCHPQVKASPCDPTSNGTKGVEKGNANSSPLPV